MAKRICSMLLVLCLLLGMVAKAEEIQPFADATTKMAVKLMSTGGNVKAGALIVQLPAGYSGRLTIVIQKQVGTSWKGIANKEGGNDVTVTAVAEAGTTYRAFAICRVYDSEGKYIECMTATSEPLTY